MQNSKLQVYPCTKFEFETLQALYFTALTCNFIGKKITSTFFFLSNAFKI